jgi:hypothetical protein
VRARVCVVIPLVNLVYACLVNLVYACLVVRP